MATYKEIKGVTVQTRDEDPSLFEGSWSSGGNMNTAKGQAMGAGLSNSAAIVFGGYTGSPGRVAINESYDGTSFTEVNDMNTARALGAGFGSQTAAIAASGFTPPQTVNVESWDGTNWTEVNNVNTARYYVAGCGSTPAGLIAGGFSPPGTHAFTETWDGTSWTEVNDLNTAAYGSAVLGTSTAALAAAGNRPSDSPNSALTEQWDGSSWTEVGDMNSGRSATTGQGLYTNGLVFSGYIPPSGSTKTEAWNGTSWTEVNNLANGRDAAASAGSQTSALCAGKETGGVSNLAEEWAFPSSPILVEGMLFLSGGTTLKGFGKAAGIPAATFASGGSLNTARGYHGGAGTDHEALLAFGGTTGTAVNNVEQYNGSSWSEVAEINTTRANLTGFGSSTAAIGGNGSTPDKSQVESWNGSAWTEIAELNTSRSDSASAGVQTSGMVATGTPVPGNPALQPGGTSYVTETWNGSAWTEVGDTNTKRLQAGMAMGGSVTAGIIASGEDGPGSRTVNAETWDGSSWTEVGNLSNARGTLYNFMGHSTSANAAGGYSGTARLATNEHWNGSSWTEINDLSTARNAAFGAGSAVNGAVFGGDTGDYQSATEEFIADATLSTVTVS